MEIQSCTLLYNNFEIKNLNKNSTTYWKLFICELCFRNQLKIQELNMNRCDKLIRNSKLHSTVLLTNQKLEVIWECSI